MAVTPSGQQLPTTPALTRGSSIGVGTKQISHIHLPLRKPKAITTNPPPQHLESSKLEHVDGGRSGRNNRVLRQPRRTASCTVSDVLRLLDGLSLPVEPDLYASLAQECTATRDSAGARELQARVGHTPPSRLRNRLLLMHATCGQVHLARQVFDEMVGKGVWNFCSWIIVVLAYIESGNSKEALDLFFSMLKCQNGKMELPGWFLGCVLKACASAGELELGKQVHALCLKSPSAALDDFLSRSLVRFYGKFRCSKEANLITESISCRDSVLWGVKIANDCREGRFHEVVSDFREMGRVGVRRNAYDVASVLKACANVYEGYICGKTAHASAIKLGLQDNSFVQCGVVDMYMKCGLVRDAERAFEEVKPDRNAVCWNAMIRGYIQNGFYVEAIKLLYLMEASGMEIHKTLLNDVRMACGTKFRD